MREIIRTLSGSEKRSWSYLETIGVSNRETVISNLLGYYFNPGERHPLGDIFIKALLKTSIYELENKIKDKHSDSIAKYLSDDYSFGCVNIKIEEETDDNKRIDIVIEAEELVIAIEFKINHYLNNPLGSYVRRIKNNYKGKENYIYLVLSPIWKIPKGNAKGNKEFKQALLGEFIRNVDQLVEVNEIFKNDSTSHQYHIYQDFINTVKNKSKNYRMVKDYIEKVSKGGPVFTQEVNNVFKDMLYVKQTFESKIKSYIKQSKGFKHLETKGKLESVCYNKIGDYQIKLRINLSGWHIEKWENNERKKEINVDYESSFKEIESKIAALSSNL